MTNTSWRKRLVLTVAATAFLLAAGSAVVAQTKRFKPGDRVECDWLQNGSFDAGTVVHYLPNDTDRGSYYRVKLDRYKLHPEGHQCLVNFIRPIGEAALKATGKYRVGDAVEARNHNGSWLPAKIVGIDGAFYKVRFENRDSRYDETIDEERLRPFGTSEKEAANQNEQNEARSSNRQTGTPPRSLPGTAWKIDFGKGVTGTLFLFCRTGTGQNVLPVTLRLHYNGETQCK